MAGRRDNPAAYRREEVIAEVAARTRALCDRSRSLTFRITDFVHALRVRMTQPFDLEIFPAGPDRVDPAFVRMEWDPRNPKGSTRISLHVSNVTWTRSEEGDPRSRFVIAHELGHIILHRNDISYFSDQTLPELQYLPSERRAEWQANTFAKHLLLPADIARELREKDAILELCQVEEWLADEVLADVRDLDRRTRRQEGDLCTSCGNFTLARCGDTLVCDICGSRTTYGVLR